MRAGDLYKESSGNVMIVFFVRGTMMCCYDAEMSKKSYSLYNIKMIQHILDKATNLQDGVLR